MDFETVNNEETFDLKELKGSYGIGGVDLSATTDLTCATILVLKSKKKYVIQHYFIPETKLENNDDKVPYELWQDRGLLTVCSGAKVKFHEVTEWFYKMHTEFDISSLWVGYDPWSAQYWVDEMIGAGFDLIKVIQGAKTMSNPMKELAADLKEKNINYNNNPITKWCLLNTAIETDKNDNIRPVKGKKQKERIDGTVSLIDAYCVLFEKMNDYYNMQGE